MTSSNCAKFAMIKTALPLALTFVCTVLATATGTTAFAASQTNRVRVSIVLPKTAAHKRIYKKLKDCRVAEKLQEFLSPFRLPRMLKILVVGCGKGSDAVYGDDSIKICYEYIDNLFKNKPTKTTPAGVAPIDTVVGPFFDTALHEFSHALFDMHKVPVLGREEGAADLVAAYIYLQLGQSEARRLVSGTAYAYFTAAKSDEAAETPEEFSEDFAEIHGTPEQRAYNLLCMAYGADKKYFGGLVSKGYLPKERAETCEEEYEQIQDAYEKLIRPYIDPALEKKILRKTWLRKITTRK
jgi:hypothetical protein